MLEAWAQSDSRAVDGLPPSNAGKHRDSNVRHGLPRGKYSELGATATRGNKSEMVFDTEIVGLDLQEK